MTCDNYCIRNANEIPWKDDVPQKKIGRYFIRQQNIHKFS